MSSAQGNCTWYRSRMPFDRKPVYCQSKKHQGELWYNSFYLILTSRNVCYLLRLLSKLIGTVFCHHARCMLVPILLLDGDKLRNFTPLNTMIIIIDKHALFTCGDRLHTGDHTQHFNIYQLMFFQLQVVTTDRQLFHKWF
jgi:hypothetical protein